MDGADLELFERSLRHATETHTGAALDAALDELGLARRARRRPARRGVDPLRAPGRGQRHVVGARPRPRRARSASSSDAPRRRAARRSAAWRRPGDVDGGGVVVRGLGTAALADARRGARRRAARRQGRRRHGRRRADLDAATGRGHRSRRSAWSRSRATAVATDALEPADAWTAAVAARPARPRPRAGRRGAEDARAGPRRTRSSAIQFGQPIATFQAVRHRLADTLVAIETADAVLDARVGRRVARRPRRWPRRSPAAAPAPPPATASRCSPASASPPSTRSTATSGASSCSTSCSAPPARSPDGPRRATCSRPSALPALLPL